MGDTHFTWPGSHCSITPAASISSILQWQAEVDLSRFQCFSTNTDIHHHAIPFSGGTECCSRLWFAWVAILVVVVVVVVVVVD